MINILTHIQDPELEETDDELDFENKLSFNYDASEFINSIGKKYICSVEFENSFMLSINEIKESNISEQQEICKQLLEQIENEFEFTFSKKPSLNDQDDFDKVYQFIYFIHSSFTNYIHYILEDVDYKLILEGNFSSVTNLKWYITDDILFDKCSFIIEKLKFKKDELIKDFLLYCNNDIIFEIMSIHINHNVTEIVFKLLEEKE